MITSESSPGAWPVEEPSKFHFGLIKKATQHVKEKVNAVDAGQVGLLEYFQHDIRLPIYIYTP